MVAHVSPAHAGMVLYSGRRRKLTATAAGAAFKAFIAPNGRAPHPLASPMKANERTFNDLVGAHVELNVGLEGALAAN